MLKRTWLPVVRAAPWLGLALLQAGCAAADAREARVATDSVRYWDLPTGSHVAYRHVAGAPGRELPPLVYVHGGPGAYQVARFDDSPEWWQRLASLGFDVYAYDQVGSGLSGRLEDPTQYTGARHVADLEAIRTIIGAERVVLIGDSWGASLSARYIATHPGRVGAAIFTSPGAIDHREWDPTLDTPQFSPDMLEWVRTSRGRNDFRRCLQLDSLLRRDVHAAYARFRDAEMDPLFDAWVNSAITPRTVHDPARAPEARMTGMGWWVQTMTGYDMLSAAPVVRPLLALFERPVLILRGESDYLPAGMAEQYAATFPNARFVPVSGSGHLIWLERPDVYGGEIVRFLQQLVSDSARTVSAGT